MPDKEVQEWERNILARFPRIVAVFLIAIAHAINDGIPQLIAYVIVFGGVAIFIFIFFRFGWLPAAVLGCALFGAIWLYDVYKKHNARLPKREKKE